MTREEQDRFAQYRRIVKETTERITEQVYQVVLPDMERYDGAARMAWGMGLVEAMVAVAAAVAAWTVALTVGISQYGDERVAQIEARILRALRRALQAAMDAEHGQTNDGAGRPCRPTDDQADQA